jgi:hypothetical protein
MGFIKVMMTAIVCLASSSTVKPPRHAAYDATMGRCLLVRQEKEHAIYVTLYIADIRLMFNTQHTALYGERKA